MSYPHAILTTWLLAFVLAVFTCQAMPSQAGELYLDVAGGYTHFLLTTPDGDYLQKDLPHSLDLKDVAYKVGLGYRLNERWSIQGGYINLGTIKQDARFVDDKDYSAKTGKCTANCSAAVPNKMTDAYQGGELTASYTFHPAKDYGISLKAGGAYLMHRFTITRYDVGASHQNYGQFPATVAGLGVSYKWAYLETTYYHGLGGSNGFMGQDQDWPLSKEMLVTWAGVKIPLW